MKNQTKNPIRRLFLSALAAALFVAPGVHAQTIPDAFDAPALTWADGGTSAWYGQTTDTYDGIDAGRSGVITDNQFTSVQTTVNGPGTVTFWWRVSSESGYDYLRFGTNGIVHSQISGTTAPNINWAFKSIDLPAAVPYTLIWQYDKDVSDTAGLDAGFVDQVTYVPVGGPPVIIQQPQNTAAEEGGSASLSVGASGTAPLTYQWRKNGLDLGGATSATYTINPAAIGDSGVYSVVVSNSISYVTSSDATLTVSPVLTIAEALDDPNISNWATGGTTPWVGQSAVTHDGVDAARSGVITHSQETWVEAVVEGPGYVTYWWKVSSESGYDYLEFYVNGALQIGRISGEVNWTLQSNAVPAEGLATLRWRYQKDSSVTAGSDRGWLDQVQYVYQPLIPPLITNHPQSQIVPCGGVATFTVGYSGHADTIQWQLGFDLIPGATNATLILSNVGPATAGAYSAVVCNTYGCDFTFDASLTVTPNALPGLTCPGNFTVPATGPGGATVTYAPSANTQCDPTIGVACAPPSGSFFPLGTTAVSCTATNGAGASQTCGFQVQVTLCGTYTAEVDAALPDNTPAGITSVITVSSFLTTLADVNVSLTVTGTWNGDIYAVLTHQSAQAVLLNRPGRRTGADVPSVFGYDDDGIDIRLDDQAVNGDVHVYRLTLSGSHATALPIGQPLTGAWAPDGRATSPAAVLDTDPRTSLLSTFNGLDPNGDWTLQIADSGAGDNNHLLRWSLELCGAQPTTFRVTSTQYDPGAGTLALTWESQSGATYEVQASTDLASPANWQPIATGLPSQGATTTYTESPVPVSPLHRFYRVKKL